MIVAVDTMLLARLLAAGDGGLHEDSVCCNDWLDQKIEAIARLIKETNSSFNKEEFLSKAGNQ